MPTSPSGFRNRDIGWRSYSRVRKCGSVDYLQTPETQAMIQGQETIDIVNSYIGIAWSAGVVGQALFALQCMEPGAP